MKTIQCRHTFTTGLYFGNLLPKRDPVANSGYGGVGFYGSSVRPSILLRPSSSSSSSPSRSCHRPTDGRTDGLTEPATYLRSRFRLRRRRGRRWQVGNLIRSAVGRSRRDFLSSFEKCRESIKDIRIISQSFVPACLITSIVECIMELLFKSWDISND